jgi:putative ABC transport system substrate-binding protein
MAQHVRASLKPELGRFAALIHGVEVQPEAAAAEIGLAVARSMERLRREGLRGLGYVEGRNIRFEYRWAEGKYDRLPELAADLIRLKVDVIVAFVTKAAEDAKNQTSTIPIVMVGVGDPVGAGLATSLARPGGNVTGTSALALALVAKQLELLKLVAPDRTAAMFNPTNVISG